LTKKHVTVALSGDAGDEVFGGYNRYFFAPKIYNRLQMIPAPLKKMVISGIDTVPNSIWDKILPFSTDKLYKLASVLDVKSEYEIYNRLISHWKEAENPVLSEDFLCNYEFDNDERMSFEEKMMMLDTNTYLPDDILVKVDRAGMAVSLESRIPFLDHRVVEFAWSLPLEFKIKNGVGKRILRDILHKHVPRELIDRPKMGFGVPLDSWLRHELKEWAENLLDEQKIKSAGLLNYSIIKKKWDEHQSGKMNWQYLLWDVLMFQDWYENNFIC
jgi:asparagine synthase (glutamine-hydrolysing)